eukprot:6491813-Alexandrium_andersonii.AAC.1
MQESWQPGLASTGAAAAGTAAPPGGGGGLSPARGRNCDRRRCWRNVDCWRTLACARNAVQNARA